MWLYSCRQRQAIHSFTTWDISYQYGEIRAFEKKSVRKKTKIPPRGGIISSTPVQGIPLKSMDIPECDSATGGISSNNQVHCAPLEPSEIPTKDPAKGRDYFNQLSLMRSSGAFKERVSKNKSARKKNQDPAKGRDYFKHPCSRYTFKIHGHSRM
jgi:hypothetical protein